MAAEPSLAGVQACWRSHTLAVSRGLGGRRSERAASQRPLVGTSKFEPHRISSICSCGRACADIALAHVPSFRVRGDEMAEILRGVSMRRCRRCRRCRTLEGRPAQRLRTLDLNLLVCRAASPCRRTIHDSCSAGCAAPPLARTKVRMCAQTRCRASLLACRAMRQRKKAGITPLSSGGLWAFLS
jgi:hypothetical protein